MVVAEKLRMHVQKIIRLIQRRREPQWGHRLKSHCADGMGARGEKWKTDGGKRETERKERRRQRERKYEKKEDEKCKLTHARVKNLYCRRDAIV